MSETNGLAMCIAIVAVWTIAMVIYLDRRLDLVDADRDAPVHTVIVVEEGDPLPLCQGEPC